MEVALEHLPDFLVVCVETICLRSAKRFIPILKKLVAGSAWNASPVSEPSQG